MDSVFAILIRPAAQVSPSFYMTSQIPNISLVSYFLSSSPASHRRRKDKLKRKGRPRKEFCSFSGAATLRWILRQLHSQTVLAHINAFPYKCTIKHPFRTTAIHEMFGNLWKLHHTFHSFWQYYINSEPCMAITQSGLNNYLV